MATYKLCNVCDGTGMTFGEHVDQPCTAYCGAGGIAREDRPMSSEPVTCEYRFPGEEPEPMSSEPPSVGQFAEQFGKKPVCKGEVKSDPPLTGNWRHGHGTICCGTLRIARSDFDTNPSPEFQHDVLEWMCNTLNAAAIAPRRESGSNPGKSTSSNCGGDRGTANNQ